MSIEAIASASLSAAPTKLMQEVNVSTTKMAMDNQAENATSLISQMMPSTSSTTAAVSFGHQLDVTV